MTLYKIQIQIDLSYYELHTHLTLTIFNRLHFHLKTATGLYHHCAESFCEVA